MVRLEVWNGPNVMYKVTAVIDMGAEPRLINRKCARPEGENSCRVCSTICNVKELD